MHYLVHYDAPIFLALAALASLLALASRRRPRSAERRVEVWLTSLLVVFVGGRFLFEALLYLLAPEPAAVPPGAARIVHAVGAFAVSVLGFAGLRGSVRLRFVALAAAGLFVLATLLWPTVLLRGHTGTINVLASLLAVAAGFVLLAFDWARRGEPPDPLGVPQEKKFDY